VFGANSQPTVFGQSSSQSGTPGSIFGNLSSAVGGGDGGTVFGKTVQVAASTNAPSSQFVFGASNPTVAPRPATFGTATPAFGGNVGGQPAFSANAAPPAFNFSGGTNNFGTGTFAATSGVQPISNPVFNFGSNVNPTAPTTAPQSAFQFRPSGPSQPSQPFMFGGAPARKYSISHFSHAYPVVDK